MRLSLLPLLFTAMLLHAQESGTDYLLRAIRASDYKQITSLLSAGLDPNLPSAIGQTPLNFAILLGQTDTVVLLLHWHADPNSQLGNATTRSLLRDAVESGNLRIATLLIEAGAHVNAHGADGRTALHFAVYGGRLDTLHLLLEQSADPNLRDAEGASPLDNAIWAGALDSAAILLAHGAHLNDPDTSTGATPLNEAAFRGFAPIVRHLLQFHPDLDAADKRGFTPFENALRMGKDDCAELLLEALPKESLTPDFLAKTMDAAVKKDVPRTITTLIRHGAAPNGLDAAAFAGAPAAVKALLENGADPNVATAEGTTPLEDAALKGFAPIIDELLSHGAQVDHQNPESGETALYAAASFDHREAVQTLLDHHANAGLCGKNRKSPYQAALANGFAEIAALILSQTKTAACTP